jgi:hypothetical protein
MTVVTIGTRHSEDDGTFRYERIDCGRCGRTIRESRIVDGQLQEYTGPCDCTSDSGEVER